MKFPPNTPSEIFTLSAVVIGYALIDDLTPNEQNSIGNWLMLIGQVLETNASQRQVLEERNPKNKVNNNKPDIENSDIIFIKNVIDKMQKQIDNLASKK